jgi:hypothetical protein
MRLKLVAITIGFLSLALLVVLTRGIWVRFLPIHHEGEIARIATFRKGYGRRDEDTRQTNQFAMIFADGFQCEGYDTSFATVKEGDRIRIRGYHDVKGWPILDPEWWECDEAQLVSIDLGTEQ